MSWLQPIVYLTIYLEVWASVQCFLILAGELVDICKSGAVFNSVTIICRRICGHLSQIPVKHLLSQYMDLINAYSMDLSHIACCRSSYVQTCQIILWHSSLSAAATVIAASYLSIFCLPRSPASPIGKNLIEPNAKTLHTARYTGHEGLRPNSGH